MMGCGDERSRQEVARKRHNVLPRAPILWAAPEPFDDAAISTGVTVRLLLVAHDVGHLMAGF